MVNPWEPNLTNSQKMLGAIESRRDEERILDRAPLSSLSRGASLQKKENSMTKLNLISKKKLIKSPSPENGSSIQLGNIESVQKLDFLPVIDESIMKHMVKHQSLHNEIERLKHEL
eukprot:CAMPEP_0170510032 /NCGR_PEP_ID=MMETSP0208-20121228/65541_1 /TAXON_ID=197538 /ORGANISM="Strombidium inclinatum, Strain S3" /LENGTH=115 /DNA_ID=CAMNT_0010793451 /DNA_START=1191 /DNA_END=1538 /DNA_ORIENTATION=+